MSDLPEPLQGLYDKLATILQASAADAGDAQEALGVLEDLVEPYRSAQRMYAAGQGVYRPHPAYHVRIEGQRYWFNWPDDKPMPTVLDLLMMAHAKKTTDPAKTPEDKRP